MFYTVFTASSSTNPTHIIDLSKNGNMFVVLFWDRFEHRTIQRHTCYSFEEAKAVFDSWCKAQHMTQIEEIKPTWDATDFD